MLYLLVTIIALIIINTGLGDLYRYILKFKEDYLSTNIIYSIVITSSLWTMMAFFIPISITIEIIFCLIGILSFIYFKSHISLLKFLKKRKLFFYILIVSIIFSGTFYPFILDHFGYYTPTINWVKTLGLQQGLSNIDLSLGQTSTWHIYQAGFSHLIDPYLRINVFVLIVFIIYTFERRRWILLCFLPVLLLFIQSPSPDLIIYVLSLIVINEIFNHSKSAHFLFALSTYAFCLKPTMIWLPIFVGMYFLFLKKRRPTFITGGLIIFFIYIFKNLWLFGYPFFPLSIFDMGLGWAPNHELLENSRQIGLLKTFDFQYTLEEIQQFTLMDYLIKWITLDGIKGNINFALILTIITLTIFTIRKKKKLHYLLLGSLLLKLIIVFVVSAQYRFFIDIFLISIFIMFYRIWYSFSKIISITGIVIFSLGLSFPIFIEQIVPSLRIAGYAKNIEVSQILKPSSYRYMKYSTHQIGNLTFNIVKNYRFSFDTPAICITPQQVITYYTIGIFPQLNKEKTGYIWKKIDKTELSKLRTIVLQIAEK